jgi:cytochrome c oxidase cbb3-type subunit III
MSRILNKILATKAMLVLPMLAMAATEAPTEKTPALNTVMLGLMTLILTLLLVIGVLGFVLKQLSVVYRQKMREERGGKSGVMKTLLLLLALSVPAAVYAQDAAPVAGAQMISGIASGDFYFLMGIISLELLVILSLLLTMRVIVKTLNKSFETKDAAVVLKPARVPFWDRFNQAVAIEKEKDILLDHNYDGIQELDNSLPPWWKYGFYFTIVIGVVYLYYYHAGGNGPSSYQEYIAEVKDGEAAKAAYLAKSANNVDENTVTMLDAGGIASGQQLFQNMCAACHAKDGGGGVGPNLADEYWLHGGGLKDVFKSIKYGWPDKGMKSWKDDFSPKQIAEITSYVKSLKGSNPAAPKEKQGELYEEGAESAPAQDTAKVVAQN